MLELEKTKETKEKYEVKIESTEFNSDKDKDKEQNFDDFWNYIENWVSNPVAFTTMQLNNNDKDKLGSMKNAAESFYVVSQHPEKSTANFLATTSRNKLDTLPERVEKIIEVSEGEAKKNLQGGGKMSYEDLEHENLSYDQFNHLYETRLISENRELKSAVKSLSKRLSSLDAAKYVMNNKYRDSFKPTGRLYEKAITNTQPTDVNGSDSVESKLAELEEKYRKMEIMNKEQVISRL
ncbi:hypothetical protein AX774_g5875 [Zancudomyces culisetae]|uniref:Uncharacterized protein n=1 Tax=Zancudomyces culisetae TaxID=1213189 RepID=A0A1R1PID7_ZANCU|nr:hypothetical protein AX774_g5875 [Zancudomyces culisetae]|eukprot:OMH80689.1 hypothetical protein AX774_g5875 [Zancudomyces culisetae]